MMLANKFELEDEEDDEKEETFDQMNIESLKFEHNPSSKILWRA